MRTPGSGARRPVGWGRQVMTRCSRRGGAWVGSSLVVVAAAILLSGCFAPAPPPPRPASPPAPPPPPSSTTTTTTTTAPPLPAHLVTNPVNLSLVAERTDSPPEAHRTITVENDGGVPTGTLVAP